MKNISRAAIVLAAGTAWSAMAGAPTTTTTVVSTTVTSTVTSTTIPGCVDAATFDSILCRLDEQSALVAQNAADLGKAATKLAGALDKATSNTTKASDSCNTSDTKASGKQLKKAIRRMIQYNHRLGSNKARKTIPDEVRTPLLDAGRGIQNDMQDLKKNLTCPPPGSPSAAFL